MRFKKHNSVLIMTYNAGTYNLMINELSVTAVLEDSRSIVRVAMAENLTCV